MRSQHRLVVTGHRGSREHEFTINESGGIGTIEFGFAACYFLSDGRVFFLFFCLCSLLSPSPLSSLSFRRAEMGSRKKIGARICFCFTLFSVLSPR